MLAVSNAHVAFDSGLYSDAIQCLLQIKEPQSNELFDAATQAALSKAFETGSPDQLIGILALDSAASPVVKDKLVSEADGLNNKSFKLIDAIINSSLASTEKDELGAYIASNSTKREQAFLIGTWEWQFDGDDVLTQIEVKPYQDSLIGIMKQASTTEAEYCHVPGEVYWRDFVFIDANTFSCINLSMSKTGVTSDTPGVGTIDYSNEDSFHLQVTGVGGTNLLYGSRDWKRIS